MSARGLDLSGEWAGVYSYPQGLPPVTFSATLIERDGWLSGVIEDHGVDGEQMPRRRGAAIQGRRAGLDVSWVKSYALREVNHEVSYEGAVCADGEEISGRWLIVGSWSGPFLMLRRPQIGEARKLRAEIEARVKTP